MNIHEIIKLSELLGQMGDIKRATKLPNGEFEPDSHHAFSLALVAYQVCLSGKLDLDVDKVVLFALVHDLLEIITGDEDTLHATAEQLVAKKRREMVAMEEFETLFERYGALRSALHEYERLDTPEAATVFVLDKACTMWTHHPDNGEHARVKGVGTKAAARRWADSKRDAFKQRLNCQPPDRILEIYEESFKALEDLLDE